MLLILSVDSDETTDGVIEWLRFTGTDYLRINYSTKIRIHEISIKDAIIDLVIELIGNTIKKVKLSEISCYWYRRGDLGLSPSEHPNKAASDIEEELFYYLKEENNCIRQYIYYYLSTIKNIGSFNENKLNKLVVLSKAYKLGLNIPDTKVTSNANVLKEFSEQAGLITKGLFLNGFYIYGQFNAICGTAVADKETISTSEATFFPSLFQNQVDKLFELRIFYFDKTFFSAAIMSQQNEKTRLDFRNYDMLNPNRMVPYALPKPIKTKLILLMQELGMRSGSIDMIVDKKGNYIFLEINPVGQFNGVSVSCNFYIEKYIADYFKK